MPKVTGEYLNTRRTHIIDAAYRCFARKGFHNATMRDIFAEAGVSAGAVYHYFKSKEDIIAASFVYDYQRSLPVFEQAARETDPLQAMDNLITFFYQGLESAAALGADRVNIQGWGEALVNPHLIGPLREWLLAFRNVCARLIRRAQAEGRIRPEINPESAGEVILSTFLGLYLQKAFLPNLDVSTYRSAVLALLQGAYAVRP